uniref:Uncharacterized protein n=1 Tax=Lepeophtheirus salmonis TaxID=72036 RepID=A0A0K2TBV0_LEPSM
MKPVPLQYYFYSLSPRIIKKKKFLTLYNLPIIIVQLF